MFAPEQPDLNWANAGVRAEFEAVLRFWLERGVDACARRESGQVRMVN